MPVQTSSKNDNGTQEPPNQAVKKPPFRTNSHRPRGRPVAVLSTGFRPFRRYYSEGNALPGCRRRGGPTGFRPHCPVAEALRKSSQVRMTDLWLAAGRRVWAAVSPASSLRARWDLGSPVSFMIGLSRSRSTQRHRCRPRSRRVFEQSATCHLRGGKRNSIGAKHARRRAG